MATSTKKNPRIELIRAVKARKSTQSFGYGIGLASAYIESIAPCIADDQCFKRMLSGVTPSQWEAAQKSASGQLTFSQEETTESKTSSESGLIGMKAILSEVQGGAPELPAHCALVFRNFVTTNIEDRDRDILDPMGAIVDKSMPLLWQHLQPQPIGKMLGIINQNEQFLKVASCICDVSDLAFDSIKMVEAGILRISHGFKPKSFEPIQAKAGEQTMPGFHVKRYEVVEESLVSVPANVGAFIDAWATLISRKQVKSDIVLAFGQKYYELRDTKGQVSCSCKAKSAEPTTDSPDSQDADGSVEKNADGTEINKCSICDAGLSSDESCQSCGYVPGKSLPESIRKSVGAKDGDLVRVSKFCKQADVKIKDGSVSSIDTGERLIVTHVVPKGQKASYAVPRCVKLWANIEGSFEWIEEQLSRQIKQFVHWQAALGNIEFDSDYDYCYLEATMPSSVVICVSGRSDLRYYEASYSMVSGKPILSADSAVKQIQASAIIRDMDKSTSVSETEFPGDKSSPERILTIEMMSKEIAILSMSCTSNDLKQLDEIARIAENTSKSIRRDVEDREFEKQLSEAMS